MQIDDKYTTIGTVYDYICEMHQKTGQDYAFPDALDALRSAGKLLTEKPEIPPFYSGMDIDSFHLFIRGLSVHATAILPQAHTFVQDPTIDEAFLFPEDKDVFCFLNMPYMLKVPHSHYFFEITHVEKGNCTLLFEGDSAILSQGDVCIVSPGSKHSLPMEPGCIALSTVVRKSTFDKLFRNLLTQKDLLSLFFRNSLYEPKRANYILLKTGDNPMVQEAIQQLFYESNLSDSYANDCSVSLLNLYLARVLRAARAAITLYDYKGYSQRDFDFAVVLQFIQQNYRTVSLPMLADTFHFSESYISKLIRKNLNQNFTDILRTLKMSHAVDILMNTPLKIREISEAVGYDSVDHFTRTFKRVYGMPPLEYRKHMEERLVQTIDTR